HLACSRVDDSNGRGVLLQVGDDIGGAYARGRRPHPACVIGWAKLGSEFNRKGVSLCDVVSQGVRNGGGDEGGDGYGQDDGSENERPDEVGPNDWPGLGIVGLQ